jgi:hypothetical protein
VEATELEPAATEATVVASADREPANPPTSDALPVVASIGPARPTAARNSRSRSARRRRAAAARRAAALTTAPRSRRDGDAA